jgi:hypothetical protein
MATKAGEQTYGPTSGVITGWFGLLVCAVVVVVASFDSSGSRFHWLTGALLVGLMLWAVMLRPRIVVREPGEVELRNPFSAWVIPLAAIDVVAVRAVTNIEAVGKTYTCAAVGRRLRKMRSVERYGADPAPKSRRTDTLNAEGLADLMTEQVLSAAAMARRTGHDPGPVTRVWAVPELVLLGVFVVALGVSFL